jgi:hypothetical protein
MWEGGGMQTVFNFLSLLALVRAVFHILFHKRRDLSDHVNNYQLFKRNPAP